MTMKPIFRQSSFYYVQWQVSAHKPISPLQALWPIENSRFCEGVGVRFPHATRLLVLKTSILLIDLPGSIHNQLIAWAQTVMLGFPGNRDQCHDLP